MWYSVMEEEGGTGAPNLTSFFRLDLLEGFSRFVLTIRQMAVTIARNASQRSFIISLTDSFICGSSPFDGLIIAHNIVLNKWKI